MFSTDLISVLNILFTSDKKRAQTDKPEPDISIFIISFYLRQSVANVFSFVCVNPRLKPLSAMIGVNL